jgi:glutamate racemase
MTERPVGFIDSGIGGLPYLSHVRSLLPRERFVHVADRENFPYGEKSREKILEAVIALMGRLVEKEDPKLVVVACNTMSVVALGELRRVFPIPFVGVVPAVKPAAEYSPARRVAILATQRTVEDRYTKDLIERFADGCRVEGFPAADLVEFVETGLYRAGPEERSEMVRREADRFRRAKVDTVVLGCTHFLHLEEDFKAELGDGVRVIDSREGVARQVARLLGEGSTASRDAKGRDGLYITGAAPIEERYGYFADKFGLFLEGTL